MEKLTRHVNSFKIKETTDVLLTEMAFEKGIYRYQLHRQILDNAVEEYIKSKTKEAPNATG